MRKLIIVTLATTFATPAFAYCMPDQFDPLDGLYDAYNCGYGGPITAAQASGGSTPAVPCHTTFTGEQCPDQNGRVGDGGVVADTLGFGAAAMGSFAAATGNVGAAVAAGAMAIGAASADALGAAANSGAVGDAAAASAAQGGGY